MHPDEVARAQDARERAGELAALVNRAFRTLAEPLPRAQYVLAEAGHGIEDEGTLEDAELIERVFEARAALHEPGADAREILEASARASRPS